MICCRRCMYGTLLSVVMTVMRENQDGEATASWREILLLQYYRLARTN